MSDLKVNAEQLDWAKAVVEADAEPDTIGTAAKVLLRALSEQSSERSLPQSSGLAEVSPVREVDSLASHFEKESTPWHLRYHRMHDLAVILAQRLDVESSLRAAPVQPSEPNAVPDDEEIRSRFEGWASRQNLALKRKGDSYASSYGAWCWEAFYAATMVAATSPAPETAGWISVSANDPTRGVAWIDHDATHVGKIVDGQRYLLPLAAVPGKGK